MFINLGNIEQAEPKDANTETPPQLQIQKGMYYVHLYAALEKTINEVVEQTLTIIKERNVKNKHYTIPFNTISLNGKLQAFKIAGYKDYTNKSIEIFNSIEKEEILEISNTVLSTNLMNIWHKTIQQTLLCFGIPELRFSAQTKFTIDEIVDKRNAVAHGRDTPTKIGERYRTPILRQKTNEIENVVDLFISAFESFITNQDYLKAEYKNLYIKPKAENS